MEFFQMGTALSILFFIVLMAVLVGFHEWGHLYVARANGVFCEIFSFGMGRKLFEWKDKYGTKWRISLFPIGGYVKMFGDADATSVREQIPAGYTEADMQKMSAFRKTPWQRILIALGGPVANFVMAIVLLFGLGVIKGIPEPSNNITVISKDTLAYSSGLRTNDKVKRFNNTEITSFDQFVESFKKAKGTDFSITVERNGQNKTLAIKSYTIKDGKKTPIDKLGICSTDYTYKRSGLGTAFKSACIKTWDVTVGSLSGLVKIFQKKENIGNVGGIISIFKMSAQGARNGISDFILTLALLSAMLGAMNLLPIPCLDGGTVFINAIEWLIGHPLSDKIIEVIFSIGLIIVVGLMSLGLWNDITHLSVFSKIMALFK